MPKKTFFQLPDQKREQIIQAALEEFDQHPYQETSVNHIIEKMGISTGSFYQYFTDKKDLYFYLLSRFMDAFLAESQYSGIKIDLLNREKNAIGARVFQVTRQLPYYQSIFVDNFNAAPKSIKRDWTFEVLLERYLPLYDFSFFDQASISPICRENKELIMSMFMTVSLLVGRVATRGDENFHPLYTMCYDILQEGIQAYSSGQGSQQNP